jgi:hypothetical protein
MIGVKRRTAGLAVTAILNHIRSLEGYVVCSGARLVRGTLPEWVHGRVCGDLITLRAGLTPEQELPTLVHELAHWLAHRGVRDGGLCTVFEYEAEAVEALVMARLGFTHSGADPAQASGSPTEGLLSASVARVLWASGCICGALGLNPQSSEPQSRKPPSTSIQRPVKKSFSNMNVTA